MAEGKGAVSSLEPTASANEKMTTTSCRNEKSLEDEKKNPHHYNPHSQEEEEEDNLPIRRGPPSPETDASLLSRVTLWWLNELFRKGYKRQIQEDDLWEMKPSYKVRVLSERLEAKWKEEQKRALVEERKPSLLKTLIRTHLPILDFIENSQSQTPPPAAYHGYGLAVSMLVLAISINLLYQGWNVGSVRLGVLMRGELIDLIFRKATRLSARARLSYPDGAIVNLMSTDVSRIDAAMLSTLLVLSIPVYTIVIVGLLCHLMGPAALLGAAILILVNPLQAWTMGKLSVFRKRASEFTDRRIKLTTEVLQGIKVIKFFAWENNFLKKLSEIRERELKNISTLFRIRSIVAASSSSLPVFASAAAFVLYAALGEELKPSIIFPALAYFTVLRTPLMVLPSAYTVSADAYVAIKRIEKFLQEEETKPIPPPDETHSFALSITNGHFFWEQLDTDSTETLVSEPAKDTTIATKKGKEGDDASSASSSFTNHPTPFLSNINLQIPRGALVAVVGPVGSGKSSLLQAMIGTMSQSSGTLIRGQKISYASQTPWIQNATIRDNILFDSPYDPVRYQRVIQACSLVKDFAGFPAGDQTEIGERGVNLSGGQKARLSLARSVYFTSGEMVILDDPLSAVDAHVGKRLWQDCMMTELRGRTRIIATHQLHVLPEVDYIVCMREGAIVQQGTFDELMMDSQNSEFRKLMEEYGGVAEAEENEIDEAKEDDVQQDSIDPLPTAVGSPTSFSLPEGLKEEGEDEEGEEQVGLAYGGYELTPQVTRRSTMSTRASSMVDMKNGKPQKLMQEEERESGAVSANVYTGYLRAGGALLWTGVILFFLLQQVANVMGNQWISWWSEEKFALSTSHYIAVYVSWAILQLILINIATQLLAHTVIRTANIVHDAAFKRVLHSPMAFFDTTPLGRILNRFSRDVDTLDSILWTTLYEFLTMFANVIGTIVLVILVYPWLVLAILPLMAIYYFVSVYYRSTSREVKRLDSNLRSFLYAYFSESLTGLATLKGYQAVDRAIGKNQDRIDLGNRPYYLFQVGARWLSLRVNALGASLVFATVALMVGTRFSINAASAGLVLSYLSRISGDLNWLIQRLATLENNMNSAERLVHYVHNLEQEPPAEVEDHKPTPAWPQEGKIVLDRVSMRYRPGLPLVLKDVSLSIEAGHKIGVVGRTGAGKSSLIQALFRLVELDEGHIYIDGLETSLLGTADLRARMAIIPQDPVLFQGTFRYNLDPLGHHADDALWRALETSDLKTYVQEQEGGLDAIVAAQGENLSVGQRQLVCLSRALLAKSKVVVLDEATASVDLATDALIQKAIREDFAESTVVTIAHRLNTIIDYNKILVMDHGRVAEYDCPKALLERPDSIFSSLVDETGEQNAALLRSLAGCS
ncbi:hypothetical protein DFQ27_002072 [Actinomortierella ambigua]|uniref:Uncharacterized protein n=1 Tax=Actinomortierella ambigua TaxID=1343610 RepID=A0A9P6Q8C0_9FUNG|nr:hypothetical protein DFQ27_002072 [Actinomortierella ambigua]